MKIERIEVTHHRLPLRPAFAPAWDSRPRLHFDVTVVRVYTDNGLMGVGSGDAMAGFDAYRDLFLGQDPLNLQRHHSVLASVAFHAGRCWPLDIALWDLRGKVEGRPLYELLGNRSNWVRT